MMMFKKVFSRGTGDITRSIRLTKEADVALHKLADDIGISLNAYIVMVIDVHLQLKLDENAIMNPFKLNESEPPVKMPEVYAQRVERVPKKKKK